MNASPSPTSFSCQAFIADFLSNFSRKVHGQVTDFNPLAELGNGKPSHVMSLKDAMEPCQNTAVKFDFKDGVAEQAAAPDLFTAYEDLANGYR